MKLTDALAAFNRKERYWLIRNALGPGAETLGADFRRRLGDAIGLTVPDDAWWAMDYHLDWLVGALHLVDHGVDNEDVQVNVDRIIKGNQEDMDLVVAFDTTLILVEAKGATSWGNEQIDSKIDRLSAMLDRQKKAAGFVPRMLFVLASPSEAQGLKRPDHKVWPRWMMSEKTNKPYWIGLDMALDGGPVTDGKTEFRQVVRCSDGAGSVGKAGTHWKVARSRVSVPR
jgi:hypothetical protein